MGNYLKILFAEKLANGNISIYGYEIPADAIGKFKTKIDADIKNNLYVATVSDHKEISEIWKYPNYILYRVKRYSEEPGGFYMVVEFEDNNASKDLFNYIKSGISKTFNIKGLGKICTYEAFHDQYLAKSLEFKFFRWLRRNVKFIDRYYHKHSFHTVTK